MVDWYAADTQLNPKTVTNSRVNVIANGHLLLNGLHAANLVEPENKLDHEFNSKPQPMVDLIVKDWEHKHKTAIHNRAQ